MGLGGPRKRAKLPYDPNNTNWTHSTSNYGHKMLLAQGWAPGSLLGAVNAPHTSLHTDANSSHIRVALKDDNLGLGATRGNGRDEVQCTGLDSFQDLLGRLNGKSNVELEKEQQSREDFKRAIYTERRWGVNRFVSGGFLVGEKIQELADGHKTPSSGKSVLSDKPVPSTSPTSFPRAKAKTMRLAKPNKGSSAAPPSAKIGNQSHYIHNKARGSIELEDASDFTQSHESSKDAESRAREFPTSQRYDFTSDSVVVDRMQRKAEKAQRKLDRQRKREARKLAKSKQHATSSPAQSYRPVDMDATDHPADRPIEDSTGHVRGAAVSPSGGFSVGRYAARRRFIQQKQMALKDTKSLNEILMIKAN